MNRQKQILGVGRATAFIAVTGLLLSIFIGLIYGKAFASPHAELKTYIQSN